MSSTEGTSPRPPHGRRPASLVAGVVLLALVHALLFPRFVDLGSNAVLACVDLFALFVGLRLQRTSGGRRVQGFIAGYLTLFVLFFAVAREPLLFAAFAMLYAAAFRRPFLLGIVVILALSVFLVTPYWLQTTLLLGLFYAVLLRLWPQRRNRFLLGSFAIGFLLIIGVVLPLLYLCFQTNPQTLLTTLGDAKFREALLTSLGTATISTLIVLLFGLPLAYALARLDFWGKRLVDSLVDLPIVIPQSVAGIALLVVLGPKTPVGAFLRDRFGVEVSGSYLGIIICQVFVSSPFLIRSAMNAFHDQGTALENVSRTLGASPWSTFFRVSLPLAAGAIFTGGLLTWARALSEVGSLMVLAYQPFTVSIYTYDLFVSRGLDEAQPAAVLLVIVCLWGFLALRWLRDVPLGPLFRGGRRGAA